MDLKKLFKNKIFLALVAAVVVVVAGLFMIRPEHKDTHIADVNKSFVTADEARELVDKYVANNQNFVLFFVDEYDLKQINESIKNPSNTSYRRVELNNNKKLLKALNATKDPKIILHAEDVKGDSFWEDLGEIEHDSYEWHHFYRTRLGYGETAQGRFIVKNNQAYYADTIDKLNGKQIPGTE